MGGAQRQKTRAASGQHAAGDLRGGAVSPAIERFETAKQRWEEHNPRATDGEREKANSLLFCEIVLGQKQVDGFCRRCSRVHEMTVIPMESDPAVFRIVCRCAGKPR